VRRRRRLAFRGYVLLAFVAFLLFWGFGRRGSLPRPAGAAPARTVRQASVARVPAPPPSVTWVADRQDPPSPVHEPDGILLVYGQPTPLWAQNPDAPGPIASTTKLMTAYLASQALPLDQVVTVSDQAAATGGSEMFLKPGDRFTVRQLLTGMVLRSANNAAVALAEAASGSTAAFVAEMNRTAAALGLRATHFADPDGLDPASASSAADLARIAELDLASPTLRRIFTLKQTSLPENPTVVNIDGMVWRDPTSLGLKTGWTSEAGACLVFAATRPVDGVPVTLVGVLLHGRTFPQEYQDAENLLNWGYAAIGPTVAALKVQGALPALTPPG
jgi:D-alanyl-D-alanine carboxypeptidase (penicillin-binding protein 5/6)